MTDKLVYCLKTLAVVHWTKLCYKAAAFFIIFKRQMPERRSPFWSSYGQEKRFTALSTTNKKCARFHHWRKHFLSFLLCDFVIEIRLIANQKQKIKDKYVSFNYCYLTLQGVGGSRDYFKYLCRVPIVDLWHSLSANIGTIHLSPYTINSLYTKTDTFGTGSDCPS